MADDSRRHASTDQMEPAAGPDGPADTERAPNTLLNVLIGGIAGVLLSFVPLSTVLGGGVAGYLEDGDFAAGAKVGALAGVVAFVPFVLIIGVVLVFVPVMPVPGPGIQLALWVSVLFVLFVGAVYTVGLGALGGVLGVYLKEET